MGWWWLSFADEDGFRGVIVAPSGSVLADGDDEDLAMTMVHTHSLRINPGGEVAAIPIPEICLQHIPEEYRDRLLTREEGERLDSAMGEALGIG